MWAQMGLPSSDPGLLEPAGEPCHRLNDLTAERTSTDAAMTARSPAPGMCGWPLHTVCSCCRPAGRRGSCNCVFPEGAPVQPLVLDAARSVRQPMTAPSHAGGGRVEKIAVRVDAECSQAETIVVMDYSLTESRQAAASKTPGWNSNPAHTRDESSDQSVAWAMARTCDEVAALHLEIRRWQEATGQNQFADIYDSQPDLRDALGYYVTPGGNFWFATTSTGCCPLLSGPGRWIPADSGADGMGAAGGVL